MKIYNRKAKLEYHILETLEAGVVLSGAEVKSVRLGRADLNDSFAKVQNGILLLKNVFIPPYQGSSSEYDPKRDRKLLVHKHQLQLLVSKLSKGSMALIPLAMYITHNLIKVELALGAAKRKVDKRRAIKEKDELRKMQQDIRNLKS